MLKHRYLLSYVERFHVMLSNAKHLMLRRSAEIVTLESHDVINFEISKLSVSLRRRSDFENVL
jgi:hypothetical protein